MNEPTNPLAERLREEAGRYNEIDCTHLAALLYEAATALTAQEAAPPQPTREQMQAIFFAGVCAHWEHTGGLRPREDDWEEEFEALYASPSQPTREQIARECYAVGEFDEPYDPERHDRWWNEDGDAAGFALQYLKLADRIRALYASPSESAPQGWQPIETAPKDGTEIVAVGRAKNCGARIRATVTAWYERAEDSPVWARGWSYVAPGIADIFEPTHWQPLPASPQQKEVEG